LRRRARPRPHEHAHIPALAGAEGTESPQPATHWRWGESRTNSSLRAIHLQRRYRANTETWALGRKEESECLRIEPTAWLCLGKSLATPPLVRLASQR
jgi:hypothetical protein